VNGYSKIEREKLNLINSIYTTFPLYSNSVNDVARVSTWFFLFYFLNFLNF